MPAKFLDLIKKRKTAYDFSNKPVSNLNIKKILEAGRLSASSQNSQPWKFIVIKKKENIDYLMSLCYYGEFYNNCSALIVIVLDPIYKQQKGLLKNKFKEYIPSHKYLNIGFACSNIVHEATDLGLANCILSLNVSKANLFLKVPKGSEALLAIGLGYENKPALSKKSDRKSLKEITYQETYGGRYSP